MLLISVFPLTAHEKHNKKPEPQTQVLQPEESPSTPEAKAAEPEIITEEETLPSLSELMLTHLHNKIVHFPLAFGMAGALFVLLSRRKPQFESSAKILWGLGAVAAIAAYFTGQLQEEAFENSYLEEILELHENLGIASGLSLWVGFLALMFTRWKQFLMFWAVVVLVVISITGFCGGILAHA